VRCGESRDKYCLARNTCFCKSICSDLTNLGSVQTELNVNICEVMDTTRSLSGCQATQTSLLLLRNYNIIWFL